jgi:acetyl esterase/lipase
MASEELAAVQELLRGIDLGHLTIPERRAAFESAASPPPPGTTVEPVDAGGVPAEWVIAAGVQSTRVLLYLHGGAYQVGSPATLRRMIALISAAAQARVLSVDYRLAPEHPWPAAPDDCEAAARWLVDNAQSRFGSSRLAIGGSSAGATLALTTLLRLRNRGAVGAFTGAALQFGAYDLSAQTPAGRRIADEYFIQAYVGQVKHRTAPDISPIFGDLRGLPPALLVVGSTDVLLDDNLAMAARLSAAGNAVELRIYPESPHGFTGHPTAMARTALSGVVSWLRERVAGP